LYFYQTGNSTRWKKSISTFGYDPGELIGEYCLNIKSENFNIKPDIREGTVLEADGTNNSSKLFQDYLTGTQYEILDKAVKTNSGDPNSVALPILISLDGTTNAAQSRTATPIIMRLANVIDEKIRYILVGYLPDRLPFSFKQMMKLMAIEIGERTKEIREDIYNMCLRQHQLDYLYWLFEPLLKYQDKGFSLQIGHDQFEMGKSDIYRCFPHFVFWAGDTQMLDYLAGTYHASKFCKCRICDMEDITKNEAFTGTIRSSIETSKIGIDGQTELLMRYQTLKANNSRQGAERKKNIPKSSNLIKLEEIQHKKNLKFGYNKLINLFEWEIKHGVTTFHGAFAADYLHTVWKGIIENTVTFSIQCIDCCGKIDPKYVHSLSNLDHLFKIIPSKQSLNISKLSWDCRFSDGISVYFKELSSLKKNSGKGTGFVSVEGWKMPIMALHLLFCINNDIVPYKYENLNLQSKATPQQRWNFGEIIIKALFTVIDFYFSIKAKSCTQSMLDSLPAVVVNMRSHVNLLYLMRKDLMLCLDNSRSKQSTSINNAIPLMNEKLHQSVKNHLLLHLVDQKKQLGADLDIFDTNGSEKFHSEAYKLPASESSRRYCNTFSELLTRVRHNVFIAYLESYYKISDVRNVNTNDEQTLMSNGWQPLMFHGHETLVLVPTDTNGKYHLKAKSKKNKKIRTQSASDFINLNVISWVDFISMLTGNKTGRYFTSAEGVVNEKMKPYVFTPVAEFTDVWKLFCQGSVEINLLGAIKYRVDEKNDLDEDDSDTVPNETYTIMCINKYILHGKSKDNNKQYKISVCNFVVIDDPNSENAFVGEVCAIMSCENKLFLLIIVCALSSQEDILLPLPPYKYLFHKHDCLEFRVVSIESVINPVSMIRHSVTGNSWEQRSTEQFKTRKDLFAEFKGRRWACMTYEFVNRDKCIDFKAFNKHKEFAIRQNREFKSRVEDTVTPEGFLPYNKYLKEQDTRRHLNNFDESDHDDSVSNVEDKTIAMNNLLSKDLNMLFENEHIHLIDNYITRDNGPGSGISNKRKYNGDEEVGCGSSNNTVTSNYDSDDFHSVASDYEYHSGNEQNSDDSSDDNISDDDHDISDASGDSDDKESMIFESDCESYFAFSDEDED